MRILIVFLMCSLPYAHAGGKKVPLREDPVVEEIEKLINQLGADDSQTRAAAGDALEKLGEPALPWVGSARASQNARIRKQAAILHAAMWEARPKLALPDGVIRVILPPGELRMEHVIKNGNPLVRVSVDKHALEAKALFLGDKNGATRFEAAKDGIHWVPASGGKDFVFGLGGLHVRKPDSTLTDPDYFPLDKLKAGDVFLTTPSIKFVFGKDAPPRVTGREGPADAKPTVEEGHFLPEGVTHIALPPYSFMRLHAMRSGKPYIQISTGSMLVETQGMFFGNRQGAIRYEAEEDGIAWVPKVGKGYVIEDKSSVATFISGGGTTAAPIYYLLSDLTVSSVFVTHPNKRFEFGPDVK